ncbi:hypothetical protein TNCT_485611 [Trichonephila clavata]|uniref:Uncharacterized protein n=1 Tax=Trichonephila clavata TaxID=2740835 RepID=A0A8X6H747_TRICU|nr:hypothetical protein TNCT_485611 [Trichonephila clavata]
MASPTHAKKCLDSITARTCIQGPEPCTKPATGKIYSTVPTRDDSEEKPNKTTVIFPFSSKGDMKENTSQSLTSLPCHIASAYHEPCGSADAAMWIASHSASKHPSGMDGIPSVFRIFNHYSSSLR